MSENLISKYEKIFNEKLNTSQKEGLLYLINQLSNKPITKPQMAYMLATVKHETANTYQPIEEFKKGKGKPYGEVDPETGKIYYGRGYVQLTWKDNYRRLGKRLGYPLLENPDLALQPDIAFQILYIGMIEGLFTGIKLSTYVTNTCTNFKEARKVINKLDKADLIKSYAEKFLSVLT